VTEKSVAEILIVEDSPTQAEKLAYILERQGYGVRTARNGKEALDILRGWRPGLIISDIMMPEMDGFSLCKAIKKEDDLREIPVILLTALSDPGDVLKGLECGADNFITKPCDEKYLLARIHHVLVNAEMRRRSQVRMGVEIFFKGERHFITSERQQILDLLLSTYETAVMKNQQLKQAQEELETSNEKLEKKVEDRTSALLSEIEERKRAEEEIKRLNSDLERRVAERTAQLEETNKDLESFNYSISHDLKGPLRAINNFSTILLEDYFDEFDAESRNLLKRMSENAKKMSDLIEDMLVFSRASKQGLRLVEVDMEELVRSLVGELKTACQGKDIAFDIGRLPPAYGDRSAIKQVFSNLMGNALKFTQPKPAAKIEVGAELRGGEVVYFVRDNGVGFDDAYANTIFGVFQRLHDAREFEGTGIGLAIVHRFISKLGGRVWAEGRKNEGAAFYFTLPKKGA